MTPAEKKQQKLKLWKRHGILEIRCVACGEDDWRVLEEHHIAGGHSGLLVLLCPTCHRKLTMEQEHLPPALLSKNRDKFEDAIALVLGVVTFLETVWPLLKEAILTIYEYVDKFQKKESVDND